MGKRVVKQFVIGKDFTEQEIEILIFKLAEWFRDERCDRRPEEPLKAARELVVQCLNAETKDGSPWRNAPEKFANRIKIKAAYDMESGQGIAISAVKHPDAVRNLEEGAQKNSRRAGNMNPLAASFDVEKFREVEEQRLLNAYPDLDTEAMRPHVRRLTLLYSQQELIDLDLTITTSPARRSELLKTMGDLNKTLDDILKILDIHPESIRKKINASSEGNLGELVAMLDNDEFREREELWNLQLALQLWAMSMRRNGRGDGPQLELWELWHMTRSIPFSFTCRCLHYDSMIELGNGRKVRLGKAVKNKVSDDVLCFNTDLQAFETRPIVGWYELPLGEDERWLHVSFEGAPLAGKRIAHRGAWVTNSHRFMTHEGWKRADELLPSDEILVEGWSPSTEQEQLLVGTLLGDAGMRRGILKIVHTEAQREWLETKARCLGASVRRIKDRPARKQSKPAVVLHCTVSPYMKMLNALWYAEDGTKIVPRHIELSPRALAAWYLDDGSLTNGRTITLSTNAFSDEDRKFLIQELARLGIGNVVLTSGKMRGQTHPRIVLRIKDAAKAQRNSPRVPGGATKFFELIAPYVPITMQYKLPEQWRGLYDPSLWAPGPERLFSWCRSIVTEPDAIDIKLDHTFEKVYCIEVAEHHNFVTSHMVVENCGAHYPHLLKGFTPKMLKDYLTSRGVIVNKSVYPKLVPQEAVDDLDEFIDALPEALIPTQEVPND